MKIKEILFQLHRDFTAIYVCGHCGHEKQAYGYDDVHFHQAVIPEMVCEACGKKGEDDYQPLPTRYPGDALI